jgi:TonB family protein
VSQSDAEVRPQAPADPDPTSSTQRSFELTLLDLPTLPVSLVWQTRCLLRERRASSRFHDQPEERLPLSDQRPWYRELPAQIQALLATPKAAPARFNSRASDVPDLWQDYLPNPYSWANSLLVHLLVLTALVLPFALRPVFSPPSIPKVRFDITRLEFPLSLLHGHDAKTGGGGGGGVHSPLPASRGALPYFSHTQFTPPAAVVPTAPVLPMTPTLIGPPELKLPAMKLDMAWGDPSGVPGPPSGGPGRGDGIGDGNGTGVGPGNGPGYGPGSGGGNGGDVFSVGGLVSEPIPIYSPEPAYSEEARKAKFQGIVMLWVIVDAQGNVRNVQISKHLGMGLDEEAVKTVSTWRFKPALRQGVAVPVRAQVEVSFRLF